MRWRFVGPSFTFHWCWTNKRAWFFSLAGFIVLNRARNPLRFLFYFLLITREVEFLNAASYKYTSYVLAHGGSAIGGKPAWRGSNDDQPQRFSSMASFSSSSFYFSSYFYFMLCCAFKQNLSHQRLHQASSSVLYMSLLWPHAELISQHRFLALDFFFSRSSLSKVRGLKFVNPFPMHASASWEEIWQRGFVCIRCRANTASFGPVCL